MSSAVAGGTYALPAEPVTAAAASVPQPVVSYTYAPSSAAVQASPVKVGAPVTVAYPAAQTVAQPAGQPVAYQQAYQQGGGVSYTVADPVYTTVVDPVTYTTSDNGVTYNTVSYSSASPAPAPQQYIVAGDAGTCGAPSACVMSAPMQQGMYAPSEPTTEQATAMAPHVVHQATAMPPYIVGSPAPMTAAVPYPAPSQFVQAGGAVPTAAIMGAPMATAMPMGMMHPGGGMPMPQMPQAQPQPPHKLTDGIPTPGSIEQQRHAYAQSLDDQLGQGTRMLESANENQKSQIRQAAEQEKMSFNLAIEEQLKAQEMVTEQQASYQLMALEQTLAEQKALLEQQASQAILEYNQRKMQDAFSQQQYDMQKKAHERQIQMQQEMQRLAEAHQEKARQLQESHNAAHAAGAAVNVGMYGQLPGYGMPGGAAGAPAGFPAMGAMQGVGGVAPGMAFYNR